MPNIATTAIVTVAGAAALTYLLVHGQPLPGVAAPPRPPMPERTATSATPAMRSAIVSPFDVAETRADDPARRIAARRARLQANNYDTPDAYYTMTLSQLTPLARKGDSFALIQMAEQYESEWETLQDDPAFERAADPQRLSRQLFVQAIKSGYPHVAAAMAVKSLEKDNLVDAYAWSMVADVFHDRDSATLNREKARFASLTPAERAQAQEAYRTLEQQLGLAGLPVR